MKDGFSVIDNVLYYISGKTKIKIKEHFAETKVTLWRVLSDTKTHPSSRINFLKKPLDITPAL